MKPLETIPQFQDIIRKELMKQAVCEEQKILDAIIEKLYCVGIIRAGEEIMKRVTETGFVCYKMPNYFAAKNKYENDDFIVEINDNQ